MASDEEYAKEVLEMSSNEREVRVFLTLKFSHRKVNILFQKGRCQGKLPEKFEATENYFKRGTSGAKGRPGCE